MNAFDDIVSRRPLTALLGFSSLALGAYLATFAMVLDKPLTLGELGAMVQRKEALARSAPPGKVIIVAGSNGRFSHSCETISQELRRPCVNMSLVASVAPDVMLGLAAKHVQRGDLIYVPLEYPLLTYHTARTDATGPWLWRHDRSKLLTFGWDRTLHAAFAFDLRFLIEAPAEMLLTKVGINRRTGVHTLDRFGDETSNTVEAGRVYRDAIKSMSWAPPKPPAEGGIAEKSLADLVRVATSRGARVVGGLPTTFDDSRISAAQVHAVEALYRRAGADFVKLGNLSQYPRSSFFDTSDHLLIPSREIHSRRLASALGRLKN